MQDITELAPEYAPDYYKILQNDEEFYRESTDNDGHLVSFNAYKPVGDPPYRRWVLNQALLDELDCEIPKRSINLKRCLIKCRPKELHPIYWTGLGMRYSSWGCMTYTLTKIFIFISGKTR